MEIIASAALDHCHGPKALASQPDLAAFGPKTATCSVAWAALDPPGHARQTLTIELRRGAGLMERAIRMITELPFSGGTGVFSVRLPVSAAARPLM